VDSKIISDFSKLAPIYKTFYNCPTISSQLEINEGSLGNMRKKLTEKKLTLLTGMANMFKSFVMMQYITFAKGK
jgi:hypothetical protein